jgi:pathogenesis-related protein 1
MMIVRVRTLAAGVAVAALAVACGSTASTTSNTTASGARTNVGSALTRTPVAGLASFAPKGNLPSSTLSAADIQATLDAHNAWRAKNNEAVLTWDASLASLAQDWSNQMAQTGNFDHRPNNNEGENIFTGSGQTYTPKDVTDAWGNEVANYHADTSTCDANAQCGHYTQIVWASTARVGCASATAADGSVYWTCNYDPPGNVTGVSPFDLNAQTQPSG